MSYIMRRNGVDCGDCGAKLKSKRGYNVHWTKMHLLGPLALDAAVNALRPGEAAK